MRAVFVIGLGRRLSARRRVSRRRVCRGKGELRWQLPRDRLRTTFNGQGASERGVERVRARERGADCTSE